MKKRLSRLGIYQTLDKMIGPVDEWLDAKELLDAEFLASEAEAVTIGGEHEHDDEDIEEWLERRYG